MNTINLNKQVFPRTGYLLYSMVSGADRLRSYVVDGAPVVTGMVSVGDAWACTNPSLG
jgi:hypothetical protein